METKRWSFAVLFADAEMSAKEKDNRAVEAFLGSIKKMM